MAELLNWLFGQYADYPTLFIALELIAVLFGVSSVLLASKTNILVFPIGLVSTAIFVYLLWKWQLFGDMFINAYYSIMSIYGWIIWSRKTSKTQHTPISYCNKRQLFVACILVIIAFCALYYLLKIFTDSVTPIWDAIVAAFAWSGMWLLAKRKIENWILLNISNAIAIPLLLFKHLQLTAVLTLILFIVAVFGYFRWKRLIKDASIS